ncbi:MAG: valine--tRNA ligase [Thermoplasmata archaeon HGW-Thermoplasmata-1]|nr:MAG: valine--tRNA ligase [Thermoplasmata archaeon HGW-Thermoplasmata-1]
MSKSIHDVKTEMEERWRNYWEDKAIYRFDAKSKRPSFRIDTPPPTVSGNMHIGHAFSYAQQDFIARYHRMKGENVFYPFGTDDNGLPTERLVEKVKKVKSTRMPRPDFVRLCEETVREIKDDFISDWKRIGMSCDFSNPYSTIDAHCRKTSQRSFLELYEKGLVARQSAPSMWCVNCQTAIAQAELEDRELPSTFNDVTFTIAETGEKITIATTRPELLPACVCVFVHPEDARYTRLVGMQAIVPLFNQKVPIFADQSANPEKGSGILMICSYGDRFDVDAINRKRLSPRVCISRDGTMSELAGGFAGLPIKEARKAILSSLDEKGLLTAKHDINHAVNAHDKCGTEVEFLATPQWFIKVIDNKERFKAAGDMIKWHPESMKARYDNWVENLNWDWCVSRQRHFGVPFPIWYSKKTGEPVLADIDQLPVDPLSDTPKNLPAGHSKEDLEPEMDVMDTWATSSVSPQIVTNWIGDEDYDADFDTMFPMTLRPQAHDIIRTWAFYTIVKSIYHEGKIPWEHILISGNVADPKGEKMSKSKGNVVHPRDVIAKYSADAMRFWAAGSKLGDDLAYMEKDLVTGQKFVTKLWNASSFAGMHLEGYDGGDAELETIDRWLLSRLNRTIESATAAFEAYEYSKARSEVELFFWRDLCDNYLEIVKDRLYNWEKRGAGSRRAAQYTLHRVLLSIIKMMAPIMPFITEEIYQTLFACRDGAISVHVSAWPAVEGCRFDEEAEKAGDAAVAIIGAVRKHKTSKSLSLRAEIKRLTIDFEKPDSLKGALDDILAATNASEIVFGKGDIPCDVPGLSISVEM